MTSFFLTINSWNKLGLAPLKSSGYGYWFKHFCIQTWTMSFLFYLFLFKSICYYRMQFYSVFVPIIHILLLSAMPWLSVRLIEIHIKYFYESEFPFSQNKTPEPGKKKRSKLALFSILHLFMICKLNVLYFASIGFHRYSTWENFVLWKLLFLVLSSVSINQKRKKKQKKRQKGFSYWKNTTHHTCISFIYILSLHFTIFKILR